MWKRLPKPKGRAGRGVQRRSSSRRAFPVAPGFAGPRLYFAETGPFSCGARLRQPFRFAARRKMQDSLHVFREEGQLRCEYVNHGREMKSNRENFAHYWGVVVFMLVFGAGLLAGRSIASSQPDDSRFAARAIQGGMAEVKLGRLAQDLGGSDAVKAFGKRMVEDHSKADDTLQEIASREKMTLPGDITRQEQANLDRLGKLS